jgi:hypothetical protein
MSFKPTGDFFDSPRPDYNFDGDDSMTNIIINAIFDGVTSLKDIIENNLDNIINDVISKYMSELVKPYQNNRESLQKFLTDLKLESAAEAYRRIYSEIRRYLGRNLTQKDINKLRPIVSNKIAEIQLAIKNNYLK